jgi:uncharacterized membrane protein YkoI
VLDQRCSQSAERETGGRAICSDVEIEDGKAVVEVIVPVTGDQPSLFEVEIDGETNEVLEVEADDGDDEEEDDDEDDEHEGVR